jgi:hypothetical protein
MARIYYSPNESPFRGTLPVDKTWPHGSRQVIRNAMTDMYFNIFSRYALPRRMRRAMARSKMHNVYKATKQDQLAQGIVGNLPKKETWLQALARKASDIFKG